MKERPSILKIAGIKVFRDNHLLIDIPTLSIEEGEVLSIIGPNGAGKTTLLQVLASLLKPSQGDVYFRDQKIDTARKGLQYRRRIAMVFQEPLLFDTTVFNNVASGLKIHGIKRDRIGTIVKTYLDLFGISHIGDRSARRISGGEAQRTSLARAFALEPEIVFLDEPFAMLDQPTRDSLIEDLQRIIERTKTTIVLATHDRMEALRLSDRIAVMKEGRIVQIGSADEVMNRPADEFVASFVGMETIVTGDVIRFLDGSLVTLVSGKEIEAVGRASLGERVALCIRPENVMISVDCHRQEMSARNVFEASIVKIVPKGFFYRVELDCGFPLVAYITGQSLGKLDLKPGKGVWASFKATAVHVVRIPTKR